jgi:hypothetical protein
MIMIDDIGIPAAEAALDLPDFSQFYTSRVNHKTEDGQTYAEKVEEAISTARDAWPAGSKYEIIDAIALGGMGCDESDAARPRRRGTSRTVSP